MTALNRHRAFAVASLVIALAARWGAAQPTALAHSQIEPHGFVVTLPSDRPVSARDGLQIEVDSRWIDNFGYRPVRVRVISPKLARRDHLVTMRLNAGSWDWRSGGISVEQEIELPMGAKEATAIISVPQLQTGHRYWWEVWVNGRRDNSLSVDAETSWQLAAANNQVQGNALIKFLLVGKAGNSANTTLLPNADIFEALVVPPDQLPTKWIDFTAIDVLAISPQDLEQLRAKRPETLGAIHRWIRSGGQAWISPVGQNWEALRKVEELLAMSSPQKETSSRDHSLDSQEARGWLPIKLGAPPHSVGDTTFIHLPSGRTRTVRDTAMIERLESDPNWAVTHQIDEPAGEPVSRPKLPADSSEWYVQRPLGLGYVRVFREAWDPVGFGISLQMLRGLSIFEPAQTAHLTTPLAAAIETTRTWESRHGMTPDTANADFADLLVPGVGLAPVTEFRVLITLFVLVIGPLNYWILQRTHRLHLLVLTVPATAAVLTLALFGYALVSDGLGTKVRVRSFTSLDQRTGEAACWARLSYYAGLAPPRGLTMPDDVAVYPILPGWNESNARATLGNTRQVTWTPKRQRLTEGWLRSRTPTQLLTLRARATPAKIEFKTSDSGIAATNELGTEVEYIAATDETGRVLVGREIDPGATQQLQVTDSDLVLRRLQDYLRDNRPEAPVELAGEATYFTTQQRRQQRRFMRNQYGLAYALERLGDNLQSGAIGAIVGSDSAPVLSLPPRTYVAITKTSPEVVLGVSDAEEEASFHVLLASW